MNAVLHVHKKDNVVTCLRPISKGEQIEVEGKKITAASDIAVFHKMAAAPMAKGDICYKYGQIIGIATKDIPVGSHVHVQNLESTRGRGDKH